MRTYRPVPTSPIQRAPRWRAAAVAAVFAGLGVAATSPVLAGGAGAAVVHGQGYQATVLGWSSWYGSYDVEGIGTTWCVDHGSAAPDVDHAYQPTSLTERAPETQQAIAWALGSHGTAPDRESAAALMLAVHDLMGASYPGGTLSVDALRPTDLDGFDGREAAVVEKARSIRADAVAHAGLAGPLELTLDAPATDPGSEGALTVSVRDASGRPVAGIAVALALNGAVLAVPPEAVTGADGAVVLPFTSAPGENTFSATATVPDLDLQAFAPTRQQAQRIGRPALRELSASTSFTAVATGTLLVSKVDSVTGAPVAGATLAVARDSAGDGAFGEAVATVTSTDEPVVLDHLLPGRYQVTEVEAPPGYAVADEPAQVDLRPGASVEVAVADAPLASLAFEKVPSGPHDTDAVWLAGATFVVRDPSGAEVATCTTDADGRCALAPLALLGGVEHCWEEVASPPGWGLAPPGCAVTGAAGSVTTVVVDEPSEHGEVSGAKVDAETGAPLAGAIYDLHRERALDEAVAAPPPPTPPPGAAGLPGHDWVAVATSGADGILTWPPQVPGHRYCAVERTSPAGYEVDPTPACTEPLPRSGRADLTLADAAIPAQAAPIASTPEVASGSPVTARAVAAEPGLPASPVPFRQPSRVPVTSTAVVPSLPRTGGGNILLLRVAGGALVLGGTASLLGEHLSRASVVPPAAIRGRRRAVRYP